MTRRNSLVALFAVGLAACGKKVEAKRYPMEGEVLSLDTSTKLATIKHGKIGDWMEAMTMEYRVKPDAEFLKLKPGDKIRATVVVEDESYYLTEISVSR